MQSLSLQLRCRHQDGDLLRGLQVPDQTVKIANHIILTHIGAICCPCNSNLHGYEGLIAFESIIFQNSTIFFGNYFCSAAAAAGCQKLYIAQCGICSVAGIIGTL